MIVKNTSRHAECSLVFRLSLLLLLLGGLCGCTSGGRRNDLRPLTENSFDDEYQQHFVITDDSVKPFDVVENKACLHVELPQKMTETCLDTVFSSYTFVPLETREECLIGQIAKIIKCPGCYCILDRDNANVFLFEEDGRFRCKLGNKGHAGNEHLDVWNVAYDSKNNLVVLLDLTGRRLLSYDLEGKLQKVTPMYFLYTDMAFIGDGQLCMTGTSYNAESDILDLSRLVFTDRNQRPLRAGFLTTEANRSGFSYVEFMQQYEDKAYFTDLISDTLWEVSGKSICPVLVMNVNSKTRFSQEEMLNMTDALFKGRESVLPLAWNFFVTSDYLILHITIPGEKKSLVNLICNRKNGHRKLLGNSVAMKRYGDYMFSNVLNFVYDNSTFIRVLDPSTVLMDIKYGTKASKLMTAEEKHLLMNLQPDDNPVLLLEHLVKF